MGHRNTSETYGIWDRRDGLWIRNSAGERMLAKRKESLKQKRDELEWAWNPEVANPAPQLRRYVIKTYQPEHGRLALT